MGSFGDILKNELLICSVLSWAVAQLIKTVLHLLYYRKLDWERIWGSGGMPSSHSSTVCALAAGAGIQFGFDSFQFAVSCILAVVVMYDACGVRRAAGEHAKLLNELGTLLASDALTPQEKLKEFIGHTPLQVLVGAGLGISVAVLML